MTCYRDTLIHETDDRFGSIRGHGEVELDAIDAGLEETTNLVRHRVNRRYIVKQLAKGSGEALVRAVEQWAKHKEPRTKLASVIQIGSQLQNFLEFAAHI